METRPRDNKTNKVKFVDYRMKWIVLPSSESYFEETKHILVKFYLFSCIQNTIRRIAFENAYESSIIFQPFLYANVPAESPFNVPTFFRYQTL